MRQLERRVEALEHERTIEGKWIVDGFLCDWFEMISMLESGEASESDFYITPAGQKMIDDIVADIRAAEALKGA